MKTRHLWLAALCLASGSLASAREEVGQEGGNRRLNLEYYGQQVLRPGLRIGLEYPLREGPGARSPEDRLRTNSLFIAPNATIYYSPGNLASSAGNDNGFMLTADLGYRHAWSNGVFADALAGAGYLRRFSTGPTYALDAVGGDVRQAPYSGNNYLNVSLAAGVGVTLGQPSAPLSLYLRPMVNAAFPRRAGLAAGPEWGAQVGAIF